MNRLTFTIAAAWSAAATTAGLVALTIAAELSAPAKQWLAATFSHHWIGKGVLAVLCFFVLTLLIAKVVPKKPRAALQQGVLTLATVAAVGAAVLVLFFLWHVFA